jgi:hypothetical protein
MSPNPRDENLEAFGKAITQPTIAVKVAVKVAVDVYQKATKLERERCLAIIRQVTHQHERDKWQGRLKSTVDLAFQLMNEIEKGQP